MRSALQAVADAVYTLLQQDGELVALATGGIWDVVKENPDFPFLWYEVDRPRDARGFGTCSLPQLAVRVHTFTQGPQLIEAQNLNDHVVQALADKELPLDPTAYRVAGWMFSDAEVALGDEVLRGVPVHELVAIFHCYV